MTPNAFYKRLNRLIWMNRLPDAKIVVVNDQILPNCYGITLQDRDFVSPVIFLNLSGRSHWMRTMVHECLHVAEPALAHGFIFEALVETYYRRARKNIKGLNTRRGKPRMKDEGTDGIQSYMDHIANAASFEAFQKHEVDPKLSAETLAENSSLVDFKSFAQDYPKKLFPLLAKLRPEFQELFIEYWILEKSQYFIGPTHGFVQTRVWQTLRIIEQMIGSIILLGPAPDATTLRPILETAGIEREHDVHLSSMIALYASTQSYAKVAEHFGMAIPMVRKIFRPAITTLLASKDVNAVAVGAYLRSLTHWASLTKVGLSKSCKARLRRVHRRCFDAPPAENSPMISFGRVDTLNETPWCMFEISSDHRMEQIMPDLRAKGKRLFGKRPAQIFAPLTPDGQLAYGYIFARCAFNALTRALTRVRGISEMAAIYDDEGGFIKAVTISNADVQKIIENYPNPDAPKIHMGDFVQILTGEASRYCGTVVLTDKETVTVDVSFPTGRMFKVKASPASLKLLPQVCNERRGFWGVKD